MASDRTERLLNLVLCLTSTRRPVSRESLRDIIPGYAQSPSDTSFQRMFERDKDDLRSQGIPVETVTTPDGEVLGYVIANDSFWLPEIRLTQQQLAVLGLAAQAWSQAALGARATHAVRKLEAASASFRAGDDDEGGTPSNVTWAVRPSAGERALPALWEAIRTRTAVSFAYRGLRDVVAHPRNLHAWGVIGRHGGWYLVGWDVDREGVRIYRTSRMTGVPSLRGHPAAYDIPPVNIQELVSAESDATVRTRATIALAPGAGARIRRIGHSEPGTEWSGEHIPRGWDVFSVDVVDEAELVAQLAALGRQARVLEPTSLDTLVSAHLHAVRSAHLVPTGTRPSTSDREGES